MGEKLPKTFRDGVFVIPGDGEPLHYEVTCEPGDFTTEIGRELIGGKVDLGDGKERRTIVAWDYFIVGEVTVGKINHKPLEGSNVRVKPADLSRALGDSFSEPAEVTHG